MSPVLKRLSFEIVGILFSALIIIPTLLIILNSFKNSTEAANLAFSLPTKWHIFDNYAKVFEIAQASTAFWNSLIITGSSVALVLLLCSTSAFIIQRRNDGFTKAVQALLLSGIVLPLSIITTYVFLYKLHLTSSFLGIILLYTATMYPIVTFLYIGFYNSISRDIDEAAIIDGTSGFGLFFRVIFPLLQPMNATAVILTFITVWNDFGIAVYFLNSASKYTLGLTVFFFFGEHSSDWNLVFADLVVVSVPVIIAYLFLQKYIVSGLTAGAVKS
ncbi:carbohydrate ABC transporter permease [Paenibacillus eucommiae]|uniref:Raffinose/stachyose/melibiose transport system permease protein n=1 Tax=Paenibacillus eucommiae TaxID=1355755 RepID=A0ABS4IXA6_9BACL|nr:carbohydrate ABC transporter permease [Paenibacillus eucommiae]MBP1992190.1 raffinose/stachyose/melibiose transport system permease protein [Paenibacillus eucommiae]